METPKKHLLDDLETYSEFPNISAYPGSSEIAINRPGAESPHLPENILETKSNDKHSQIPPDVQVKVYKRRWYILLVFSLLTAVQGGYWNTWGPISASTEEAFGWDDADIALLSNWGPIAYIVSAVLFAWIIDVKGIRLSVLITGFLVAGGAGLRCITSEPPYVQWTIHAGQLLNGLGGPVAMGLPPALSAVWFPPHERTTATALSQILNSAGVGASFIIGPYLVTAKPPGNQTLSLQNNSLLNDTVKSVRISNERREIMFLMYVEFGFAMFVFLLVLIYFPDRPKQPPSTTASIERMQFKKGLAQLLKNLKFWMICLTYGISLGVINCWQSVLDVNLKPHGISEDEAGWIGFYSTAAGCVSSLVVARFADIFAKHMRLFLLILYTGGSIAFGWFAILINGYIPNSTTSLYVSIILGNLLVNATSPLYYETACETTYPVAEGITNLWLTMINNVGGLVFLLVQMIPNIGTAWENWCVLGAVVVCIPILCLIDDRYNRLEIDESSEKQKNHA